MKLKEFHRLFDSPPLQFEEKRNHHRQVLIFLRELIELKKAYQFAVDQSTYVASSFIDQVTIWMYTTPSLLKAYANFLQLASIKFNEEIVEKEEFGAAMLQLHESIMKNSSFGGFKPKENLRDPHFDGYIPHCVFKAFSTPFMMFPRLTIEDREKKTTEIAPDFVHYLKILKEQKRCHLYINAMERIGDADYGLTTPIEELAQKDEFQDVFILATLDKRSDFYWQKNAFENHSNATLFKKVFIDEMFDKTNNESRFKWPFRIDLNSWKSNCGHILDEIQAKYYGNKADLTASERRDFIEITYVKIIESLCQLYRPAFANATCKDSVDRGPSLLALVYTYKVFVKHSSLTTNAKMKILNLLFAPPVLVHNRPAHTSRIERFASALRAIIGVTQS